MALQPTQSCMACWLCPLFPFLLPDPSAWLLGWAFKPGRRGKTSHAGALHDVGHDSFLFGISSKPLTHSSKFLPLASPPLKAVTLISLLPLTDTVTYSFPNPLQSGIYPITQLKLSSKSLHLMASLACSSSTWLVSLERTDHLPLPCSYLSWLLWGATPHTCSLLPLRLSLTLPKTKAKAISLQGQSSC